MLANKLAYSYKPSEAERKAGKYQGDPTIVFETFVVVGRDSALYDCWPNADLVTSYFAALTGSSCAICCARSKATNPCSSQRRCGRSHHRTALRCQRRFSRAGGRRPPCRLPFE